MAVLGFKTRLCRCRNDCWHEGQISDDDFLANHAMGAMLYEIMGTNPDKTLTVLCGHSHSPGQAQILPNLKVKTGGAEYGSPTLQEIIAAT